MRRKDRNLIFGLFLMSLIIGSAIVAVVLLSLPPP